MGFPFSSLSFYSFHSLAIVSCHIILLFLLWYYLVQACWASLGLLFMTQYSHLGLFGILLVGSCIPFVFSWASLAHLLSLALFLTLHSHSFLLTSLGFPGPITLSLILGAHGPAINPLFYLLALLWVYCDLFSLFHVIYHPWVCYSSLFGIL